MGCEEERRSLFRLRRQLSHRQQSRDHRRCRGHARQSDRRDRHYEDHAGPVGRRFQLRPRRLAADTAYGAARLLKWLVDRKIAPHIPVWDTRRVLMAPSAAPTLSSIESATSISVRVESCCTPPEQSSTAVRCAIAPLSETVMFARLKIS